MAIDRTRRVYFEQVADAYNASRPTYPIEIVTDIIQLAGLQPDAKILEVGCGPGNATIQFARRGYAMLCIELGEKLAGLARQRCAGCPRVVIVRSAFEDYDLPPGAFNLAFSADALHWIPPEVGYPKLARALKPGGTIALSWHVEFDPCADWSRAMDDLFRQYAPDCQSPHQGFSHEWLEGVILPNFHDLLGIDSVITRRYHWSEPTSAEKYANQLLSRSHYINLSAEIKQQLAAGVQAIVQAAGGCVDKPYEAALFLGKTV